MKFFTFLIRPVRQIKKKKNQKKIRKIQLFESFSTKFYNLTSNAHRFRLWSQWVSRKGVSGGKIIMEWCDHEGNQGHPEYTSPPVAPRMGFKSRVLAYREANGSGPSYLQEIIKSYRPAFPLYSKTAKLLSPHLAHVRSSRSTKPWLFVVLAPQWYNHSLTSGQMIPTHLKPQPKKSYFQTTSWWSQSKKKSST